MHAIPDRITRRVALSRLAGLAALPWALPALGGEDEKKDRRSGRIYLGTGGPGGNTPPEASGILVVDPKEESWVRIAPVDYVLAKGSPDGKRVLAFRQRPREGRGLFVIDASGGDPPRKIAEGSITRFAWSPDGSEVVYGDRKDDGSYRTYRIRADGNGREELPIPTTDIVMAWSRDGLWFATSSRRGMKATDSVLRAEYSTYLMHPDGTGERRLLEAGESRNVLDFSPDGKTLLLAVHELGEGLAIRSTHLDMIGVDGRGRRTFLGPRGRERPSQAAWSPDGAELAVNYLDSGDPGADATTTRLEIVSLDGKRSRRLNVLNGIPFGLWDWR